MASAAHGQRHTLPLAKIESPRNVGRADAAHDQRWMPMIECGIIDQTRRFIVGRIRRDQVAGNFGSKLPDRRWIKWSSILPACSDDPSPTSKHRYRAHTEGCTSKRRLLNELSSSGERH